LIDLINQAVGDAVSDFLLVEVILAHRRWGPSEWDQGYEDLPNRLVKVNVQDRFAFKTEDAERRLVEPKGLQERVDAIVRKFEKGRSFVRPSGTEDCVRVYAEASTRVGADGTWWLLLLSWSQLTSDVRSRTGGASSCSRIRLFERRPLLSVAAPC
jgi:phosphoacetylglucosamine mutase